ncbi:coil containing protein, partial [Vibrio phage 1.023.O._10N.222.51.B4]
MATPGGLVDKQELIDAQLDTAHLGRVVNSKDASGAPINTSTNRTGGVNKTLDALEAEYQGEIDALETRSDAAIADAEDKFDTQREQFDSTFQAQFQYGRIGNISDYVGQSLPEADKLNSYQYPDDSDEWYGPIQSQTFPITIPADPTVSGSGWALVNALTPSSLGGLTNYQASSVADMINGNALGGTVSLSIGQRWIVDDYYGGSTPSESGVLFFKVVAAGTGTDDGGKYIDVPGGVFQLEQNLKKRVDIKAYGAVPDCVSSIGTDNTLRIQRAFDYANANKYANYIPAGRYLAEGLVTNTDAVLFGDGRYLSLLCSNETGDTILSQGSTSDTWGVGGTLQMNGVGFIGTDDWASLAPVVDSALVILSTTARAILNDVSATKGRSSNIIFNSSGYTHIEDCDFSACNVDDLLLKTITTEVNAVTSTHIENTRMSTGLVSGLHMDGVYNVTVVNNQLEDNEIPFRMSGDNYNIVINGNYVEATRGDYDFDASAAATTGLSIYGNYLFGTPNIQTFNFNTNLNGAHPRTFIYDNHGATLLESQTFNELANLEWLQNSRNAGSVNFDICKAHSDPQQFSQANVTTALGWGVSTRASSTAGAYWIGLTNSEVMEGGVAGKYGYMTQESTGKGAVNREATESYQWHIGEESSGLNLNALKCTITSGDVLWTGGLGYTMTGTPNATQAALFVRQPNVGGRSINASGTVNASGADYAEYMTKCHNCGEIAKGDICGIDKDGKLTTVFSDAISFVVKSTDPSYVGGDTWHLPAGEPPILESKMPKLNEHATKEEIEAYNNAVIEYSNDVALFNIKMDKYKSEVEKLRETVDRIAFCGQVPVNAVASVGDYIIPESINNKITGKAVVSPSFDEYMLAVGKVIKVDNGVPVIIVKTV